jgi:glycosyltransferase involved in cell wall biosynthesis
LGDYSLLIKKKIVIITDAWYPQINGVVTTYTNLIQNIDREMYEVEVIEPSQFYRIPFPFYKEIQLSFCTRSQMKNILKGLDPVYRYHIATEGPLGIAAKCVLEDMKVDYTTAYHTKFPDYLKKMFFFPRRLTQRYIDWFHKKSRFVFVPSQSVAEENPNWNTKILSKGYDKVFYPAIKKSNETKTLLYVGRVSREKNIEDFCNIYIPNTHKVVVGNGPAIKRLKKLYPNIEFVGYKFGKDLAEYYQDADVFVFPSKTDTFGIVILEAMACGTPVAAYPVTGPKDQIINGVNGYTNYSLSNAVLKCFALERHLVYNTVKDVSWKLTTDKFIQAIEE